MRIIVHIGPDTEAAARIQQVLNAKRDQLEGKGVLYPRAAGSKNHTRLFMALTEPDQVDTLRFNRGYTDTDRQAALLRSVSAGLARHSEQAEQADLMILSAPQLGSGLPHKSELERLRELLLPISEDIHIVAHVEEQARALVRNYGLQVIEGRATSLDVEMQLAEGDSWWDSSLALRKAANPDKGHFAEVQAPAFWLDYQRLVDHWQAVFGKGRVTLRAYDRASFWTPDVIDEIRECFGIEINIGKAETSRAPELPSAAWLARGRQLNELLLRVLERSDLILPRQLWRKFMGEIAIGGDPIPAGALVAVSKSFEKANKALIKEHSELSAEAMKRDRALPTWTEADPERGFRASQYLMPMLGRIDRATREERKARTGGSSEQKPASSGNPDEITPDAAAIMPDTAKEKFRGLIGSSFRPHNRLGRVNEEELAAAFETVAPRVLPEGNTGNVIVGCMKNEAPYIVEWVAYHRAIGVDNFLIYTNGCEDGTTEILDRLQELGVVQHRSNDGWTGNSPQQYALNQALKEPVILNAEWIIHIDVDEFMNIRCGNGTLNDFLERVPDATNVAMTWRLFGHNGVKALKDEFVIDQFDTCAPKFCPKPHTVWGFKTMSRNIGAYAKLSCHRPNKLDEAFDTKVKWVNGSGQDMTSEAKNNGWRNSKKSIGYDLLQLNHYALRSAESFLIKRQRGRALHVDRSIGINYWIRMDWSDYRDITIKRNIPRLQQEYDRLLDDKTLQKWHKTGLEWHRAKAKELHAMPEFEDLYQQALKVKLTETERVAYALALDMES